ncbi:hypothetical protein CC86DRAFT_385835 [Ophiobolus disseminans]|uniref:Uncharacterized protein n=1 Tax=Ophiobolus disseminans TaxID=1469910 RepID=A0A6A6ZLZ0_9PLEO|nr:hypothetical protein CC86DRAFT_385835 [Ophiobolus disseminans]
MEEDSDCTSDLGQRTTFALNVLNIAVVWWLLPILVKLWERQPKSILDGIMYSALQASQPGAAAHYAIRASCNHEERLSLFHNGIKKSGDRANPGSPAKVPWYMVVIHILIDAGFVLYPAVSLMVKRSGCDSRVSIPMLWFYPSVPAAIFGLWITLDAKVLKLGKGWSLFGCYVAILGVGLGISIPTWLTYLDSGNTTGYFMPIFAYFYMSVPGTFFIDSNIRGPLLAFICAAIAVAARNGPVAYSALKADDEDSVKLPVPGWVDQKIFAGFYLAIGVVCSLLSLLYLYTGGMKHHLEHLKKLKVEKLMRERDEKEAEKLMEKTAAAGSDPEARNSEDR